jgi:hypothetical protein
VRCRDPRHPRLEAPRRALAEDTTREELVFVSLCNSGSQNFHYDALEVNNRAVVMHDDEVLRTNVRELVDATGRNVFIV